MTSSEGRVIVFPDAKENPTEKFVAVSITRWEEDTWKKGMPDVGEERGKVYRPNTPTPESNASAKP